MRAPPTSTASRSAWHPAARGLTASCSGPGCSASACRSACQWSGRWRPTSVSAQSAPEAWHWRRAPRRTASMSTWPASRPRAGTGTASARSAARARSAAHAPRPRRVRTRRCNSPSLPASAGTTATTPPGATWPTRTSTWCCSWATTSMSRRRPRRRPDGCECTRAAARRGPCSSTATATRNTRATRPCSACTRRRRGSWSGTITRSRTTTPTTRARRWATTSWPAARPPTRPTGNTCRFRLRRAHAAPTCASTIATTGDVWPASMPSTTANTATTRSARGPDAAARTP